MKHPLETVEPSKRRWWKLPFDATTNFSIFGWLLDRLKKTRRSTTLIDFTLED